MPRHLDCTIESRFASTDRQFGVRSGIDSFRNPLGES